MESVIEGLLNAPGRTVKRAIESKIEQGLSNSLAVTDLISPPDLSQARVNKCLIALVNRKVVQKNSSTVGFGCHIGSIRVFF